MNYHNYAQKTNFIGGSTKFKDIVFYITSVNIPGMSFTLPEVGGRYSTKVLLPSDKMQFSGLSFEFIIDENFMLYKQFISHIFKSINPEDGTFNNDPFEFWLQINNNKGNKVMYIEFYGCRMENIGDINLNTQDDTTENTMTLELRYDYFKLIDDVVPIQEI